MKKVSIDWERAVFKKFKDNHGFGMYRFVGVSKT